VSRICILNALTRPSVEFDAMVERALREHIGTQVAVGLLLAADRLRAASPASAATKHTQTSPTSEARRSGDDQGRQAQASKGKTPRLEPFSATGSRSGTSCKQQTKRKRLAGFKCSWNAHGELPGRVCCEATRREGGRKATGADVAGHQRTEVQAPLLEDPHPIDFGYFEDFTQIDGLYRLPAPEASGSSIIREASPGRCCSPMRTRALQVEVGPVRRLYNQALAEGLSRSSPSASCWAAVGRATTNVPNPIDPAHIDGLRLRRRSDRGRANPQPTRSSSSRDQQREPVGRHAGPKSSRTRSRRADAIHAVPGNTVRVYSGASRQERRARQVPVLHLPSDALDAGGVQH